MGVQFFSKSKKTGTTLVTIGVFVALVAGFTTYYTISKVTSKVPMYVASEAINKGDPLGDLNGKPIVNKKGDSILKIVHVSKGGVPKDAVPVNQNLASTISTKDMSAGDILRKSNTLNLSRDNPSLFSARLKALGNPDLVAGEIPVDSMNGMLDGVKAGDRVFLVSVAKETDEEENALPNKTPAVQNNTEIIQGKELVKSAIIIGVKSDTSNGGKLALVVAVGKDDAVKIATAKERGKVYAYLLPFGSDSKNDNQSNTSTTSNTK